LFNFVHVFLFFPREAPGGLPSTQSSSTTSVSSVAVIVLLLNDLHELLEVGVLKVLVLPLVGRGLVKVSLADVLHNMDARLDTSNGLFVVVTEAKLILVLLDPLEALELELSTLKVKLHLINFLVEFPEPEIDLGCGAEVD
jgi:hypothetical protein